MPILIFFRNYFSGNQELLNWFITFIINLCSMLHFREKNITQSRQSNFIPKYPKMRRKLTVDAIHVLVLKCDCSFLRGGVAGHL